MQFCRSVLLQIDYILRDFVLLLNLQDYLFCSIYCKFFIYQRGKNLKLKKEIRALL